MSLLKNQVIFVEANGNDNQLCEMFHILRFPTLKLFKSGKEIAEYPQNGKPTADALLTFILSHGQKVVTTEGNENPISTRARERWRWAFNQIRSRRLQSILQNRRVFTTIIEKMRALGL